MGSSSSRDKSAHRNASSYGVSSDKDDNSNNNTNRTVDNTRLVDAHVDSCDRAVLKLKTHRKKLDRQFTHAQHRAEDERLTARSLLAAGDKRRARAALMRHKSLSRLCDELMQLISGVDVLLHEIESSARARDTVKAMEAGNKALRAVQAELSMEHVDEVMQAYEEERDKQMYANERIGGMTSDGGIGSGDNEDEEDQDVQIEEQLKLLEMEIQQENSSQDEQQNSNNNIRTESAKNMNVNSIDKSENSEELLPEAPTHTVVQEKSLPSAPTHAVEANSEDTRTETGLRVQSLS